MVPRPLAVLVILVIAISSAPVAAAGMPAAGTGISADACSYPIELADATGTTVALDGPPTRVVALTPSDAQLLWELDARDRSVGMPVGRYTSYLDDTSSAEDVTADDDATIVTERVIDQDPDLVLAGNVTPTDVVDVLREADETVYHFRRAEDIDDVRRNVRTAGRLLGACEEAEKTIAWMDDELAAIDAAVAGEERPLVYYAMGDGWTAGAGTFQAELIERAGAENLGTLAGIDGWNRLSDEVITEQQPDWIIYDSTFDEPPVSGVTTETTAYQEGRIAPVTAHYLSQPGPRVVLAVREMAGHFHPTAIARGDARGNLSSNGSDRTSTNPQPGFGPVAGAVAVTLFAILVRRRQV